MRRILSAVALVALLGACKKETIPPPATPEVTVAFPVAREVTDWDEFTGRLEATKSVEIRPRVSGYLDAVQFKDGQVVKEGDALFTIDPRPFRAEVNRARAEHQRAKAQELLAQQNLTRSQQLLKTNAIAAEQFDQRKAELELATAEVARAQAAVEAAELNLRFTDIRAPMEGRVSRRFVDEGNFVTGGAGQATLLTTIVPFNPLHVYFDVDERVVLRNTRLDLAGERKSSRNEPNPVRVALADEPGFTHEGRMDFVDNRLDPETGTLRGRALIDNSKGLLTPGLFVRLQLKGRGPYRAILIPDEAIGTDQSRRFVMLVKEDGTAERRFVETGRLHDGLRAINSGLTATDRIIINGLQRARPGAKVQVKQGEITAAPPVALVSPPEKTPAAPPSVAPSGPGEERTVNPRPAQ
jgi:RND family efflux transporter MFP subunit